MVSNALYRISYLISLNQKHSRAAYSYLSLATLSDTLLCDDKNTLGQGPDIASLRQAQALASAIFPVSVLCFVLNIQEENLTVDIASVIIFSGHAPVTVMLNCYCVSLSSALFIRVLMNQILLERRIECTNHNPLVIQLVLPDQFYLIFLQNVNFNNFPVTTLMNIFPDNFLTCENPATRSILMTRKAIILLNGIKLTPKNYQYQLSHSH